MSTFERYQGNWFEQINNYDSMVTEGKKQQESGRILRYPVDWDDTVSIVSSPWILEVEGIKLYVRKEDNYPVFKRMLESDFKEKTSDRDTTAWGKVQRIWGFFRSFYHPDIKCPITGL